MMITANRVNDFITGTVNGKAYNVPYNDEKFARMQELVSACSTISTLEELKNLISEFEPLTQDSYKETVEHMTPYLHVNKSTGEYFLHKDGTLSKHPLPGAFVQRIVRAIETKNDVSPIVKAVARFMRNPNYSAAKCVRFANYLNLTYMDPELHAQMIEKGVTDAMARERATIFQTTLTQEGLMNTYKVSTEIDHKFIKDADAEDGVKKVDRFDFDVDEFSGLKTYIIPEHVEDRVFQPALMGTGGDAFFCGDKEGHIIKVGQVHFLDSWDKVDCEDRHTGVKGLHCGNLDYIRGFQRPDTVTHNIFVDPMDIGAFTGDGTGAIRVRRYFVHSSFAGVNRGYYNSSRYAALNDAEYAKMVQEAIQAENAAATKAAEEAAANIKQVNLLKEF
jgi:hypothetical protein